MIEIEIDFNFNLVNCKWEKEIKSKKNENAALKKNAKRLNSDGVNLIILTRIRVYAQLRNYIYLIWFNHQPLQELIFNFNMFV